jgi:hypothetical protein
MKDTAAEELALSPPARTRPTSRPCVDAYYLPWYTDVICNETRMRVIATRQIATEDDAQKLVGAGRANPVSAARRRRRTAMRSFNGEVGAHPVLVVGWCGHVHLFHGLFRFEDVAQEDVVSRFQIDG